MEGLGLSALMYLVFAHLAGLQTRSGMDHDGPADQVQALQAQQQGAHGAHSLLNSQEQVRTPL